MINDPLPTPSEAYVRNNGGWAPPTKYVLTLPDGRMIDFPLSTKDPLAWARDWLAKNEPTIPLHPKFIVTL